MSGEKKGYLKSLTEPTEQDLDDPRFVKRREALRKMGFLAAFAVPAMVLVEGDPARANRPHPFFGNRHDHEEEELEEEGELTEES